MKKLIFTIAFLLLASVVWASFSTTMRMDMRLGGSAGERTYENYQVSDGVGGWENYQVSDGVGGWENYQVVE